MAHRFMLDTNIVSDLMRAPGGAVASGIELHGEAAVCTSVVIAAELRYGAERSSSTILLERVDLVLSALGVMPLESPVDRYYGRLRKHLRSLGTPIGLNDMLIAAHPPRARQDHRRRRDDYGFGREQDVQVECAQPHGSGGLGRDRDRLQTIVACRVRLKYL